MNSRTAQPTAGALRQRMAKHLTSLVFGQVDNNGEWMVHQEYTEGLVDAALEDWRAEYAAEANQELLEALERAVPALWIMAASGNTDAVAIHTQCCSVIAKVRKP